MIRNCPPFWLLSRLCASSRLLQLILESFVLFRPIRVLAQDRLHLLLYAGSVLDALVEERHVILDLFLFFLADVDFGLDLAQLGRESLVDRVRLDHVSVSCPGCACRAAARSSGGISFFSWSNSALSRCTSGYLAVALMLSSLYSCFLFQVFLDERAAGRASGCPRPECGRSRDLVGGVSERSAAPGSSAGSGAGRVPRRWKSAAARDGRECAGWCRARREAHGGTFLSAS